MAAYRHYHLAQDDEADEAILSFADALDAWTQSTGQGWLVTLRELTAADDS